MITVTDNDKAGGLPVDDAQPRRAIVQQLMADGTFDELMSRVEDRGVQLSGEGRFLPERIKAVLERGLPTELADQLG